MFEYRVALFQLYVASRLALRAGLRRSEVLGLRRHDVRLSEPAIYVRQRVSRRQMGAPKTETSRRRIPISRALAADIQRLTRSCRSTIACDLLFPPIKRRGSTVSQDERRFTERFNRFLEKAGMSGRYHPFHDLRHTFATELLLRGVPIFRVSKWLGHSSIQVTCDVYGHLLPSPDDQEVMDSLEERPGTSGHKTGTAEPPSLPRRAPPIRNRPFLLRKGGDPGRIRTCDTQLRRLVLYPG
jgi:integrase